MGELYKLTSPVGKSYIGVTSKTASDRWKKHIEHAIGKRTAGALYAALRKYGPESFSVKTIATEPEFPVLLEMERLAILEHDTLSPMGYNMTSGGEGARWVVTPEISKRISLAQKKRFARPDQKTLLLSLGAKARENRKKKCLEIRNLNNGMAPWEAREKLERENNRLPKSEISRRIKAAMASPEIRKKVLACAAERAASPTWRKRVSDSKRGKKVAPCSEERKRKISEARKREWADPIMREKRLKALHNPKSQSYRNDPAYRKKVSESVKKLWADSEYRKRQVGKGFLKS